MLKGFNLRTGKPCSGCEWAENEIARLEQQLAQSMEQVKRMQAGEPLGQVMGDQLADVIADAVIRKLEERQKEAENNEAPYSFNDLRPPPRF